MYYKHISKNLANTDQSVSLSISSALILHCKSFCTCLRCPLAYLLSTVALVPYLSAELEVGALSVQYDLLSDGTVLTDPQRKVDTTSQTPCA